MAPLIIFLDVKMLLMLQCSAFSPLTFNVFLVFFSKFILSPEISVFNKGFVRGKKNLCKTFFHFFCNCIMLICYGSYGYNKCYMRKGTLWDSLELLAPYLS